MDKSWSIRETRGTLSTEMADQWLLTQTAVDGTIKSAILRKRYKIAGVMKTGKPNQS